VCKQLSIENFHTAHACMALSCRDSVAVGRFFGPVTTHVHRVTARQMGAGASTTLAIANSSEDEVIKVFEDIDAGGDGKLSLSEIKAAVANRGETIGAEWPAEFIDSALARFDIDGDGRLNQYEFLACMNALEEAKPPKPPLMKQLFLLMDQVCASPHHLWSTQ